MDRSLRVIFVLHFALEGDASLVVALNRQGQAMHVRARDRKQGMPEPPKRRTVDLRVGDRVMYRDGWRRILAIQALRSMWLTVDEARRLPGDEGYIYRPRKRRGGAPQRG